MRFSNKRFTTSTAIDHQKQLEALQERKFSFYLALICTAISCFMIFIGIILVFTGHLAPGVIGTIIGLICTQVSQLWLNLWRETK